jgi:hypothetical protein
MKGKRLTYKFVKKQIEKNGYELLSKKYINAHTKLKMLCDKGHECYISYSNFKQGRRCSICFGKYSKTEKEISKYVKSFNIDVIENDRTQIINPLTNCLLELDIFIPQLNRAIEFNGRYWHKYDKVKNRDEIKKQQCQKKGIDLLIIEEDNWLNNKNKCLDDISKFVRGKYVRE